MRITLVSMLGLLLAPVGGAAQGPERPAITVVTFNVGTTVRLAHDGPPDDGYGAEQAAVADEHYGNSLAWPPAIEAAKRFFAEVRPDLVGFQDFDRRIRVDDVLPGQLNDLAGDPFRPASTSRHFAPSSASRNSCRHSSVRATWLKQ